MKHDCRISVLLALGVVCGFAAGPKVAPDLANIPLDKTVDVIVRYRVQPTIRHHQLMVEKGGLWRHHLELVRSEAYTFPAAHLQDLSDDPDVEYIAPDRPLKATLDFAEPAINANLALKYGYDGTGITVAVIDSGIMDSHPDLLDVNGKSRVVYAESFNLTEGNDYFDRYGHGTHVAGILGGDASMSLGPSFTHTFMGIAPKVKFVNLKVLGRDGTGTDSMVIAAIQRAIALKSTYNIKIINLSLGRPVMESYLKDPLCQAVEQAWKAGIVVVVAAGNGGRDNSHRTNGYGTITSPGNDPYVITVGAMKDRKTLARSDDQMASYSSKGPTLFDQIAKPDIVAPGNKIMAALPAGLQLTNTYPGNSVPLGYYVTNGTSQPSTYYFEMSGTSMASPMVAGAAALLLQKQPSLTPDQIKAKLMKTASKTFPVSTVSTDPVTGAVYTVQNDLFAVGAGYLDTLAALNNMDTISSTKRALSPAVAYNSSTKQVMLVNGSGLVWGDTNLTMSIVWGDQVLLANSIVWGDSLVWGDSTLAGFSMVWGDTIVWGDSNPSSEAINVAIYGEK